MTTQETLTKRSYDVLPYTVDLTDLLATGETLASVAAVVIEPATSPVLAVVGSPSLLAGNKGVGLTLSGGKSVTTYTLRVRCVITPGSGLHVEGTVELYVNDNLDTP